MDCPFCGKPLKEGRVFCENCGKEIQIVPVFEPEIEDKMQKSLDEVLEVFKEDDEAPTAESEQTTHSQKNELVQTKETTLKSKYGRKNYFIVAIACVILVVVATIGILSAMDYNSYDFQIQKARSLYEQKNYTDAATYAKRATEIETGNLEAQMLLAKCYESIGQTEDAKMILENVVSNDASSAEAYRELIAIYNAEENFLRISELLATCKDVAVVEEYQGYCAFEPQFSEEEGSYDSVLSLKLMASSQGEVHYTLDGTVPDKNSEKYITPIRLEDGIYEVSAVYINDYGVSSSVVKKKYEIHISAPDEPEITVESGTYHTPQMIETTLSSDFEIYYTTDGSTPTRNSNPYLVPIPMPLGESVFKFIMYNDDGIASNVTTKEYNLVLDTTLKPEVATVILKQALIVKGSILDMAGHLPESTDTKEFELKSAFTENEQIFYLIVEYLVDTDGIRCKTGNQYAVNITTNELYKVSTNYAGYYNVEPFE